MGVAHSCESGALTQPSLGYRTEGGNVTDVLMRNVPEEDLARIDRHAARMGLSRGEYLRRAIAQDAARVSESLTVDQFAKFTNLADDDLMRDAWS